MAAILGFFPLMITGYLIFIARGDQAQLSIILNFIWVIGLVISAWIVYLQMSFMEKTLGEFNRSAGRIDRDIKQAFLLALILTAIGFAFQAASPRYSGFDVFFEEISQTPMRLVIFLIPGLFLWALYEELTRTFTLAMFWELIDPEWARKAVVAMSAMVFALAYAYQGWGAMMAALLSGLLLGFFYQSRGRIIPMVLAHFLLNLAIFTFRIFFS